MTDYIIVNFSGGKDSTAMLLHMIELGQNIDEVIFCDTSKEFPAMYRHIEKVKNVVKLAGIKFTELKSEHDFDYYMFDHMIKHRNGQPKTIGYAWPYSNSRWCTTLLKTNVIQSYLKNISKQYNVIQCIGIASDEKYRLERKNNQLINHRHPLVHWGWTENDCLNYCYSKGYYWEGLYDKFERVSCWCCPFKSLNEYRKLQLYYPNLWNQLKEMDNKSWNQFRSDYSVNDLELRFMFEQERKLNGLSISNREFYNSLRSLLKYK